MRPSRPALVASLLVLSLMLVGCQTTMSVEEAKKVTASFSGKGFVPPPKTIKDITAVLDQQKLADPEANRRLRARADQEPPKTQSADTLANFYLERGKAAVQLGRAAQARADLAEALKHASTGTAQLLPDALSSLATAEADGGSVSRAVDYLRQIVPLVQNNRRGFLIGVHGRLAIYQALAGDLQGADEDLTKALAVHAESKSWQRLQSRWIAEWSASVNNAQGIVNLAKGQYVRAEGFYREGVADLSSHPETRQETWVDTIRAGLVLALLRQGRLLEAENEARATLLSSLGKSGRNSVNTARAVRTLTWVLAEQGRWQEAEALSRAGLDILERAGVAREAVWAGAMRGQLASALVAQGRWREAIAEYRAIEQQMKDDPGAYERYIAGNVGFGMALVRAGEADEGLKVLQHALDKSRRTVGDGHRNTAEIRGLMAMAHARKGDRGAALREFKAAVPMLLGASSDDDVEETSTRPARDQRLSMILGGYIGVLADVRGTALERGAGVDAAAEAFRLADLVRGRSVQRALDAGAARAAAKTPALADLVRREQDAKKQVAALQAALASALSAPAERQDPKAIEGLRGQIQALRRARQSLTAQIEREFPAYVELLNPKPATVEQVRAGLRPGEAVVVTLVQAERTFVWAIPQLGEVAFAALPMGEKRIETAVTTLRKALDPSATTVGGIPAFDLALAHELYRGVLEPVKAGWQKADSLLVVAHGPLGQVPFALLPTRPATLGADTEPLFANYRAVPWLVRTHAVTLLPSVTSLRTLRSLPPGDPGRRPFIGFGDPFFSEEQARRAARLAARQEASAPPSGVTMRGMPITLRSSPRTEGLDSSQLGMLPRLPETSDEIKSVALAMNADLTRDVFTGSRANEQAVKTMDLSGYKVIAFATHGLVPGELDGLTQPALALTAPDVAKVDGDGLLTMEEILGLRLNADWVVLSACNTASGNGIGSEAVSGLGRAFFYAGARALLVSNWPVETTSARALTTELFRRQSADPRLTRARALQQTLNALIDEGQYVDPRSKRVVFSYAHPIFWAPFTLIGDGGGAPAGSAR